jgi:hypothetical protein
MTILYLISGYFLGRLTSKPKTALSGLNGFFDQADDLITLRKMYFDYVKMYHPDRNQDKGEKEIRRLTELIQDINNEYEKFSKRLPKEKGKQFESPEEKEREFHISEVYKDIINAVQKYELIKIEFVGAWIWISGNTYPIRNELKTAGFIFAPVKKMWYWRPDENKFYPGRGSQPMEIIRAKYGSNVIDRDMPKSLTGLDMNLLNILNALQLLIAK